MTRNRWMGTGALVALLAVSGAGYVQAQGTPGRQSPRDAQADRSSDRQAPDGQRRGPGGPGGPGRRGGRVGGPFGGPGLPLRELDLSEAQRQQVRAILDKARQDARPAAERLRAAAAARRAAVEAVPVNEGQIRQTTQALSAAETELAIARAHARADVVAQLTADQQQKLQQLRESRTGRGPRGGDTRGGRPGGRQAGSGRFGGR